MYSYAEVGYVDYLISGISLTYCNVDNTLVM